MLEWRGWSSNLGVGNGVKLSHVYRVIPAAIVEHDAGAEVRAQSATEEVTRGRDSQDVADTDNLASETSMGVNNLVHSAPPWGVESQYTR